MVDEDIIAGFDAMREASRDKRSHNRQASRQRLDKCGVKYTSNNNGVHLVVTHNGHTVDFWPGTGKWIARNTQKTNGRGVGSLIWHLGMRL